MKKSSVLILIFAALAIAQVPTIPNELFPQFRTDLNTSLGLAVSTGGSYNNPAWLAALSWGKLTGVPSFENPLTFGAPLVRSVNAITLPIWGTGSRPVGANALGTSGNCAQWTPVGIGDTGSPCGSGGGGANALGTYIVASSANAPANAVNLGILTSGLVKITIAGGVATPATAVIGDIPTGYPYGNLSSAPSIPAPSTTTPLVDGVGAIGSAVTYAKADHVHPSDSTKQATITGAPGSWPTSFPPWTVTTGSAPPTQGTGCSLPTATSIVAFMDTTNQALWISTAASGNCWQNLLSTTSLGPFDLSGISAPLATGIASARPSCTVAAYYLATDTHALTYCDGTANSSTLNTANHQACIMNSTADAFQCYDPSGALTISAGGGLADPGSNGLLKRTALNVTAPAVIGDIPTGYPYGNLSSVPTTFAPAAVPVLISTSGPVSDPGGNYYFMYNNASGALTYNLPAGTGLQQRCYRNATGKSGVITIAVTTSNAIDYNGANGTTTTGTLVSGGALGDAVCLVSDASNHWYAYVQKGTWTNN